MASGRYLIDLTDERFKTAQNQDVVEFIRRTNPFAHSDVGDRLISLVKNLPGAKIYCPAPADCAYVIGHTNAHRIFGIAFGQKGLALRLPDSDHREALLDSGSMCAEIGRDWVSFHPWPAGEPKSATLSRLKRWCQRAYSAAFANE